MREIVLGTAGHVDHGKTSLVKALTGIDTDRLKEEKARGITIELGFAYLDLPCGHRLGIVDVPGHEKFIKNMVAGAAGIDLVAFVVAADEGIMPQTREHFEICRLLGVDRGIIIVTKKDLVEPEWLELVQDEIREFFIGSFLDDAPMIAISSTTGSGIDEVRAELDRQVAASAFTEAFGPFRLPVDRIFSIKGFGSVVTGTSISGRVKVGDEICIYPGMNLGRIRGLQVHTRDIQEVEAGHRTAINIQGIERESINRGDVCATLGSLNPSYIMDVEFLYLSANRKKMKNRSRVRIHLGTAEIMGRIVLLDRDEIEPGDSCNAQLLFEEPACAWPGDHYVVRSYSPVHTIGGGVIYSGHAAKKRRFRTGNEEIFDCYRNGDHTDLINLHLREAGVVGLTAEQLGVQMGLFGNRFKKVLDVPLSTRQAVMIDSSRQLMVSAQVVDKLRQTVVEFVEAFHQENPLQPGISKEELRSRLGANLDQKLYQFLLTDLTQKKLLIQDDSVVKSFDHNPAMAEDHSQLHEEILCFYRDAALQAPRIKELFAHFASRPTPLVKEMIGVLVRENILTKVSEDLYFYTEILAGLEAELIAFLRQYSEIDAQGFKGLTGLSRKFSIPLLEYFDQRKITLRIGDKRVLREKRT
ncbi:MAG: selenocysteine-specific translation elongation factor [Proteobacteria bacterium]|nr:selenocysteine-specific translation elongation factor [Pseudomonadota bacterium]MBU1688951.1 selenocysteine-specific translation elongation factor [Pseudomonadota bacterium]